MQGNAIGNSDEWYTPREIFNALNIMFYLDPCSPGADHWVPAKCSYTKEHNGLLMPWFGTVFMNPPFGGRNGHVPWLKKFIDHGNGIAIVRAYTSSGWWHEYISQCETIVFPKGKTKFVKPDGTIGKSPSQGIALVGIGKVANAALKKCNLGMFMVLQSPDVRETKNERI